LRSGTVIPLNDTPRLRLPMATPAALVDRIPSRKNKCVNSAHEHGYNGCNQNSFHRFSPHKLKFERWLRKRRARRLHAATAVPKRQRFP
jgi:hypothetical protein